MAIGQNLLRVHAVRQAEEQEQKNLLATAIAELRQLERTQELVRQRRARGRESFEESVRLGSREERICALAEIDATERLARDVSGRIGTARTQIQGLQREFLNRRIMRRQTETLLEAAEAVAKVEAERKTQNAMDDWYRSRTRQQACQESMRKNLRES